MARSSDKQNPEESDMDISSSNEEEQSERQCVTMEDENTTTTSNTRTMAGNSGTQGNNEPADVFIKDDTINFGCLHKFTRTSTQPKAHESTARQANTTSPHDSTPNTRTTFERYLPFIWPIPVELEDNISEARDPRRNKKREQQKARASRKNPRRHPNGIPWKLIPIETPKNPPPIAMSQIRRLQQIKHENIALYSDSEIAEWISSKYGTNNKSDWTWFAAGILGQGESLKEMMPKIRQRGRSESDACEVAVNPVDENHFEITQNESPRRILV